MNGFNEYVREVFSAVGDIVIRSMMGGYLVYLNDKLMRFNPVPPARTDSTMYGIYSSD